MIDKLLAVGSTPDLITPLMATIGDIINGPSKHIYISRHCGMSCVQVSRALRGKGVRVWGDYVIDDTIKMSVRKAQYRYTMYWLRRWGIA